MDDLSLSYSNGRLRAVSDLSSNQVAFKDASGTTDYEYDLNGNMIKYANKKITNITYNHLNLPTQLTVNGTTVYYKYNAEGQRIEKRVGSNVTKYVYNPEGHLIAELNSSNNITKENIINSNGETIGMEVNGSKKYYLKDHLGNIRVTIKDNAGTAEVVAAQDYYPFGMVMPGRSFQSTTDEQNKFKYQGKERDQETGYDYFEARFYDSSIGRFLQVDPLTEILPRQNAYTGMNNSPTNIIDPDGKFGIGSLATKAAKKILQKRLFNNARQRAVRQAWKQERQLLQETGETFTEFSAKEKSELLKTGKVKGYEGHHINSVKDNDLAMAGNPDNIKFVKGRKGHLAEHGGNFKNETSGPLMDRLSKLSGTALIAFITTFESVMAQHAKESPLISDPNSAKSWINPFNYLVENEALFQAWIAANDAQQKEEEEKEEEEKKRNSLWETKYSPKNQ